MAKKKRVNSKVLGISIAVVIILAVLIAVFAYIKNPYKNQGAGINASTSNEGAVGSSSQSNLTTSSVSGISSGGSSGGSSGSSGGSGGSGGNGQGNADDINENTSMPAASSYNITIARNTLGTGSGIITSSPVGINCGTACQASFAAGSSVTLTATPNEGTNFTGWAGDCAFAGNSSSCTLVMNSNKNVDRIFDVIATATFNVYISKTGSGSGRVLSNGDPRPIDCGETCQGAFASGASVTLTATPDNGSMFTGWSACAGTGECTFIIEADREVIVTFEVYRRLTIQKSGAGTGTITSDPSGINCGSVCSKNFSTGTSIVLTATPAYKSTFGNWTSGCDYVLSGMCYLVLSSDRIVKAQFN